MKDFEQLYYDEVYKNRKLRQEIEMLKDTIQEMDKSRSKNNIDLQKYLIKQLRRYYKCAKNAQKGQNK